MKILITGASGLLGLNAALELSSSHLIIGQDRGKLKKAPFHVIHTDLLQPNAIGPLLQEAQPDWVINCVALANHEACEADPKLAKQLNTNLPRELAQNCKNRGIRLLHISTDGVFDGEKEGFYTEDDLPNPINIYAQTKLEGEQAVLETDPKALVARVNFYGWSLSGHRSIAEFFPDFCQNLSPKNKHTDLQQITLFS